MLERYQPANLEKNLLLATEDNSIGPNKSEKREITKITFEDSSVTSAYSCGKFQSEMVEVNEINSKNRQVSLLCHKAKKKETIHAYMSQIQKKKRLKRIHRWH
ncbi:hypothetical protein TNCV_1003551 [Trichonephila clavipes]|nr:hypothetical protein TNCV_1003551 [Trichonephila clavipes]